MAREKYNAEKEHQIIGMYPDLPAVDMGTKGIPGTPQLYRPITRRENFMRFFEGKTPYWMVNSGWVGCDVIQFRPRQHTDNLANHQCFDGGPDIDFANQPDIINGWLNVPLQWSNVVHGATAKPGFALFDDVNDWKKYVVLPNLDDLDWDEIREMNKDYLSSDRVNQLGIQFSFWERMMNTMGVMNAALAIADEDQEDAIHEFMDALADLYIDYIRRICEIGRIDSVFMHDDWGTQKSPFFSIEAARKFFVPPLKKVTDFIHSKGMIYEHHSCGNAEPLVPAFIEAGVDLWTPQPKLNNLDRMVEQYGDKIVIAMSTPVIPKGSSDEEVRRQAKEWVDKYKNKRVTWTVNVSLAGNEEHDPSKVPIFTDAIYEYSRIAYQDAED